MTATPSILLGLPHILAQNENVSLVVSFHLHYLSSRSVHFPSKELSQIFVPIPGGGHATSRAELLLLWVTVAATVRRVRR
jgi:hypothetical protein